jgi:hypothetical protein
VLVCNTQHKRVTVPNVFSQNTPTPSNQLSVRNVALLFMIWSFKCLISVLLSKLVPCTLKHPNIKTNSLKTWMVGNTPTSFLMKLEINSNISTSSSPSGGRLSRNQPTNRGIANWRGTGPTYCYWGR